MYHFLKLSLGWLVLFFTVVNTQDKGFNHELPPGVELINPKDLGLSDADLGKFLGNVKVLGGGQVGDTKTQILTVGFDGDENLNLDDFDIPGLTDKKGHGNLQEKDKEIANVAFEKFKEFFKDPKKNGKSYDEVSQKSLPSQSPQIQYSPNPTFPTVNSFSTPVFSNNQKQEQEVQKQGKESAIKYSQAPKPSAKTLQQHYPVMLTQPVFSTTSRPLPVQHSTFKSTVPTQQRPTYQPQQPQNYQNHNINPTNNNFNPQNQNPFRYNNQQNQNQNQNHNQNQNQNPTRQNHLQPPNYITPLIAAQQKLNAHVDQQIYQNNNNPAPLEFGAKLPSTHKPTHKPTQKPYSTINYENNQVDFGHQQQYQNHQQTKQQQQQPRIQSTQLPPEANYQRFNLYNPQFPPKQHREKDSSEESIGKIVRNTLTFNSNNNQPHTPQPNYFQNQNPYQNKPTQHNQNQQPTLSPSSSIPSPSIQRFPDDQQRPVSHVFIKHDKHANPVQQTSFHPRFQPPTKFVENFTPSAPRLTTPTPRIEVTPSMPMILLSTNENAITDPERMERLRQQQRHREELRLRELQRQSHSIKNFKQPEQNHPEQNPPQQNQQPQTQAPSQEYSTINGQNNNNNNANNNGQYHQQVPFIPSSPPPRQFHRQTQNNPPPRPINNYNDNYNDNNNIINNIINSKNNNNNNNNNYQQQFQNNNQNGFNFKAQSQQHQLHSLQRQPNNYFQQTQQPQFYQNQPQGQSSNNFPQHVPFNQNQHQNQGGFPPRFQVRPDPHQFDYSTIRHKRGYRKGLISLLRGLRWRERD